MAWWFLGPMLGFAVSIAVTGYLSGERSRIRWLDHPNRRSLHVRPTPRTGGIGILAGAAVGWTVSGWVLSYPPSWLWMLVCVSLVAAISLIDDWQGVGPFPRLVVQIVAAGILVIAGFFPDHLAFPGIYWNWPSWLAAGLTVLFVVWMTNLYNFMDGMDGLAGGMAVIGFGFIALLGFVAEAPLFGVLALGVSFSAAGFLVFNLPPARIFMGDGGSSTIGFLTALFALWASRDGLFPIWAAVLIFSPFIADATLTLAWRALSGARIWEAHRSHAYQVLARSGWGHRRTVSGAYVIMSLAGLSAVFATQSAHPVRQVTLILGWSIVYGILWVYIRRLGQRC